MKNPERKNATLKLAYPIDRIKQNERRSGLTDRRVLSDRRFKLKDRRIRPDRRYSLDNLIANFRMQYIKDAA